MLKKPDNEIASYEEADGSLVTIYRDGSQYRVERKAPDGTVTKPQNNMSGDDLAGYLSHMLQNSHYLVRRAGMAAERQENIVTMDHTVEQIAEAVRSGRFSSTCSPAFVSVAALLRDTNGSHAEMQQAKSGYIYAASIDPDLPVSLAPVVMNHVKANARLHNPLLRKAAQPETGSILNAVQAVVGKANRIANLTPDQALSQLEDLVRIIGADYPRFKLNVGYAQDIEGTSNDGKCWFIFSNLGSAHIPQHRFGGKPTNKLPAMLVDAEERLKEWLDRLNEDIANSYCHILAA